MSLAALIAKQKAAQESKNDSQGKVEPQKSSADNQRVDSQPMDSNSVGAAPTVRLTFGRVAQGKPEPASESTREPSAESRGERMNPQTASQTASSTASISQTATTLTLDDIAGDTSALEISRLDRTSGFHDEEPCTAPDRELPADLGESQRQFVVQLDGIYEVMHDPELFGQMIRTIMQEMQEHPDYVKLMADTDVHTMIRGLRESMGLARVKKAEKQSKTRAGSKKAISAPQMAGTLDEMFNSEDW